ncbi:hypothetical protein HGQ98_32610, partial [Achromobacter ruhlandii]|nr:hypothetical protein [Achromobacter ruhlandii]
MFQAFLIQYDFNGTTNYVVRMMGALANPLGDSYRVTLPAPVGGALDIDITSLTPFNVASVSTAEQAQIAGSTAHLIGQHVPVPVTPPPATAPAPPAPPLPPSATDAATNGHPPELFQFPPRLLPAPTDAAARTILARDTHGLYL